MKSTTRHANRNLLLWPVAGVLTGFVAATLSGCSRRAPLAPVPRGNAPAPSSAHPVVRKAPAPQIKLSPSQLVGLRMIYGYAGFSPPQHLRRLIARGEASGVILFKRNVKSLSHLTATMRSLQSIPRPRGLDVPLLIMVDQEGGRVKRLPGPPERSAAQIGRLTPLRAAQQVALEEGVATGRSLRPLGINVNLAPVVDVARRGSHTEESARSYGRDAQRVSILAASFARGMAQEGLLACWKHFPGLGGAGVDQDFRVNTLSLDRDTLHAIDLRPFRDAPAHNMVMTSSAIYPAFDRRPAMFSERVVRTALRDTVGFKGLAVTDDLQVPAMKGYGSPTQRGLLALRAGNDLLLYCQSLEESETALRELTRLARRQVLDAGELRQTALRILAFRAELSEQR
ncbi:MAG: beta-N-acetylhexosaminidase [Abditibacteriota bacterium]|nr:beta-N-acetylhexosaminidase [Abditibacteriota bacterium]